ncbi:hypothetical protein CTAYLR_003160 [Chrysophaeum taylorii]|uniref:Uncharacterized protein n=1 Tax=Chrysophaeum taylorii TaxID=2483200 RepID=A0AAD7UPD0_9STRA|nr:hypothetical protein CTAYLR_003160 [Chrysophaeum taylorii]
MERSARRSKKNVPAVAAPGTQPCPVCGKVFSVRSIESHADRCAAAKFVGGGQARPPRPPKRRRPPDDDPPPRRRSLPQKNSSSSSGVEEEEEDSVGGGGGGGDVWELAARGTVKFKQTGAIIECQRLPKKLEETVWRADVLATSLPPEAFVVSNNKAGVDKKRTAEFLLRHHRKRSKHSAEPKLPTRLCMKVTVGTEGFECEHTRLDEEQQPTRSRDVTTREPPPVRPADRRPKGGRPIVPVVIEDSSDSESGLDHRPDVVVDTASELVAQPQNRPPDIIVDTASGLVDQPQHRLANRDDDALVETCSAPIVPDESSDFAYQPQHRQANRDDGHDYVERALVNDSQSSSSSSGLSYQRQTNRDDGHDYVERARFNDSQSSSSSSGLSYQRQHRLANQDALEYVQRMRNVHKVSPDTIAEFEYKSRRRSPSTIATQISHLLRDYPDLVADFQRFLPPPPPPPPSRERQERAAVLPRPAATVPNTTVQKKKITDESLPRRRLPTTSSHPEVVDLTIDDDDDDDDDAGREKTSDGDDDDSRVAMRQQQKYQRPSPPSERRRRPAPDSSRHRPNAASRRRLPRDNNNENNNNESWLELAFGISWASDEEEDEYANVETGGFSDSSSSSSSTTAEIYFALDAEYFTRSRDWAEDDGEDMPVPEDDEHMAIVKIPGYDGVDPKCGLVDSLTTKGYEELVPLTQAEAQVRAQVKRMLRDLVAVAGGATREYVADYEHMKRLTYKVWHHFKADPTSFEAFAAVVLHASVDAKNGDDDAKTPPSHNSVRETLVAMFQSLQPLFTSKKRALLESLIDSQPESEQIRKVLREKRLQQQPYLMMPELEPQQPPSVRVDESAAFCQQPIDATTEQTDDLVTTSTVRDSAFNSKTKPSYDQRRATQLPDPAIV